MDNSMFCHLHIHDEYSLLDGVGTASDYAKRAKEMGFTHLGCANHGNVDGILKWQEACKKNELSPILGCEFYMVPDLTVKEKKEKKYHIVTYAKNENGLKNIFRMLTKANLEGFYSKPRIDPATLFDNIDDLVITTACASSFLNMNNGLDLLKQINQAIPGDIYLEIMPLQMKIQKEFNKYLLKVSEDTGIKMVASHDCHYPTREGSKTQEVLLAMQTKAKWSDPKRWRFDIDDLYLKSGEEMLSSFKKQGVVPPKQARKALKNTMEIAEKCGDFFIEKRQVYLPQVPGYEDRDETELMWEIIEKGFQERLWYVEEKDIETYKKRAKEEFDLICELGFQRYFLIVWELIDWCNKNDIMTGPGRGSVGGSLVSYLMYITDVDPLRYGLVFTRFISPARIDLPDIDMDFEDIKREEVRKHLQDMYGQYNVAGVSTFLKMKGRAALRDVSRVFDIPAVDVDKAAKSIVVRSGGDYRADYCIEDAFSTFEDGKAFKKKYPEVAKLSMELEGQIKGVGQHAAGMCVALDDLREGERCNLCTRSGILVANWDKNDAEHMGMMKLDVLGLSALTVLNEARKLIKKNYGKTVEYDKIPLDDKKVFEEISAGNNIGAFQIGSLGLIKLCREMGIYEFEDIVLATALYRPGTLRSGMTNEFVRRRRGEVDWEYDHEQIEPITKETFGIILYQEQIMRFMYGLAGLPWKTCDTIRKVISKSQGDALFQEFKQKFIDGCEENNTLNRDDAARIWDSLSTFGSYGFNKSHAVEYSMITYWDMWLKVHYPLEFLAASLSFGSEDMKESLIEEAKRIGVRVELPRIGKSDPTRWMTDPENFRILVPFKEIHGVGDKTAEKIASLQQNEDGFFVSSNKKPPKNVMEKLEKIGAFDDRPLSDDEYEELSEHFQFSLSRDPMRHYRGLYNRLIDLEVVSHINEIDFKTPSTKNGLYFGAMTEVRFGYKQNVDKATSNDQAAGMGGVYGNFKDETDFSMLVFNKEVYQNKKSEIEHCQGEWVLVRASHPKPKSAMFCNDIWIGDAITSCDLEGIGIDLLEENSFRNRKVRKCNDCDLRQQCKAPVMPSLGQYNVMVAGEAPGSDEDEEGVGFIGKSGNELWKELRRWHLKRDMFHVTNIVKCYPKNSKTPDSKHVKACSQWLDEEIQQLAPIHIIAFGNTALKYFKNVKSGIMNYSGTTEWNKEIGAWVHYCIHPASMLYSPENREKFKEGVANFAKKLKDTSKL